MHCISGRLLSDCEQLILIEIGLTSRAGTKGECLIGLADMQRFTVCLCVHSHRTNPQFFQSADNANRDGAAVGYEYFVNFVRSWHRGASCIPDQNFNRSRVVRIAGVV